MDTDGLPMVEKLTGHLTKSKELQSDILITDSSSLFLKILIGHVLFF